MKSVHIRSYSGPHFLAFGLSTERYSEYGHFLRSVCSIQYAANAIIQSKQKRRNNLKKSRTCSPSSSKQLLNFRVKRTHPPLRQLITSVISILFFNIGLKTNFVSDKLLLRVIC